MWAAKGSSKEGEHAVAWKLWKHESSSQDKNGSGLQACVLLGFANQALSWATFIAEVLGTYVSFLLLLIRENNRRTRKHKFYSPSKNKYTSRVLIIGFIPVKLFFLRLIRFVENIRNICNSSSLFAWADLAGWKYCWLVFLWEKNTAGCLADLADNLKRTSCRFNDLSNDTNYIP
jgi:hypothetical protein